MTGDPPEAPHGPSPPRSDDSRDEETAALVVQVTALLIVGLLAGLSSWTGNDIDRWFLWIIGGIGLGVRPRTIPDIVRSIFGRP